MIALVANCFRLCWCFNFLILVYTRYMFCIYYMCCGRLLKIQFSLIPMANTQLYEFVGKTKWNISFMNSSTRVDGPRIILTTGMCGTSSLQVSSSLTIYVTKLDDPNVWAKVCIVFMLTAYCDHDKKHCIYVKNFILCKGCIVLIQSNSFVDQCILKKKWQYKN